MNKVTDENRQGEAIMTAPVEGTSKKLYLESYGCQMNFADSEIVASILREEGFSTTQNFEEADLIFVNTCAVRDNAEQRVRNRLNEYNRVKRKNPALLTCVS